MTKEEKKEWMEIKKRLEKTQAKYIKPNNSPSKRKGKNLVTGS